MTPLAHAGELGRVSAPMAAMSFACRMCGKPLPAKAWGGAECSRCGSVSMLALPTAETTSRPGAATASIQASRAGRCALRCADRYLGIVKRRVAAGLLIDVGTSTSPFPNLAEEAGFEVTVLGQMLPKGLSPSIRFREGSVEGEALLAQLEGVFDVVTAWAVIERLPDPVFSAKVLSRMCRPGGKIFLSTPETGTFLTDHSIGRSPWVRAPGNLCLQAPLAIAKVFEAEGCRLLTWGRVELNPLRYATRYGAGLAQALGGLVIKALFPGRWQALRDSRLHGFKGITYFVLERR